MITYIDQNNAAQYTALFRKAESALKKKNPDKYQKVNITTLERYFYYLPDLLSIGDDVDDNDKYAQTAGRRYTMLPVDEEIFEINANTRQISIPDSFKKNGIGVQGDEVAEIIYFRINRYFDFVDLNNTEIYIQWDNGKRKDVSQEWVRDIESDPNYLIFGWALDSTITEVKGPLKFSVRFIGWNDGEDGDGSKEYSFSTMEAVAQIHGALDLTFDAKDVKDTNDALNSMIMKRIKPSKVVLADRAEKPIYIMDLHDWVKQNEDSQNYVYTVDLNDNGEYLFKVLAYSPDSGHLSYEWHNEKQTLLNQPLYELIEPFKSDTDDAPIYYPKAEAHHIYYIKNIDEITNKETYVVDTTLNIGDEITEPRYELYGSYTANQAGSYYANAINTLEVDRATTASKTIEIPGAVTPGCNPDGVTGCIFEYNKDSQKTQVTLEVEAINNDTDPRAKYNFTFQWYKETIDSDGLIEGATSPSFTIETKNIADLTEADAEINKQGNYYVKVTAIRNKDKKSYDSKSFMVTYQADTITEVVLENEAGQPLDMMVSKNSKITAKPKLEHEYQLEGLNYQRYEYQWYQFTSNQTQDSGTPISNATEATLDLAAHQNLIGHGIFCKVKNIYNKSESIEKNSEPLIIVS